MKKKILIPVDFTEDGNLGMNAAHYLAKKTGSELHVIHIMEEENPDGFRSDADLEAKHEEQNEYHRFLIELTRKRKADMQNYVSAYTEPGLDIFTHLRLDEDYQDGIVKFVNEHKMDLIVMGTSGETAVSELYSGNHAEQTTNETHIPVLTIKHDYDLQNLEKIGLLINTKDPNHRLIKLVKNFSDMLHLDVALFARADDDEDDRREANSALQSLGEKYGLKVSSVTVLDDDSSYLKSIQEMIDNKDIDLIAAVSHHANGFVRWLFGDKTDELINDLNKPVLLINDDDE